MFVVSYLFFPSCSSWVVLSLSTNYLCADLSWGPLDVSSEVTSVTVTDGLGSGMGYEPWKMCVCAFLATRQLATSADACMRFLAIAREYSRTDFQWGLLNSLCVANTTRRSGCNCSRW